MIQDVDKEGVGVILVSWDDDEDDKFSEEDHGPGFFILNESAKWLFFTFRFGKEQFLHNGWDRSDVTGELELIAVSE